MRLEEIQRSALLEIGNIMISSYINAISDLSGITIELSVPDLSVNMLGGPICAYGGISLSDEQADDHRREFDLWRHETGKQPFYGPGG